MSTCISCKYWGNLFPPHKDKANTCGMIDLEDSTSKSTAFIDADASDDTGLYAKLKTVANFGCTLHSPK